MMISKEVWVFVWSNLILFAHCSKYDCVVSEWSAWSRCTKNCSVGEIRQTRTVLKKATSVFAKGCPMDLTRTTKCGIPNNGCDKFCDKNTGNCGCTNGYKLDAADNKKCIDINECKNNFGKGLCSQICTNSNGSYKCSCYHGFSLLQDGHDCHFNSSSRPCNLVTHRYNEQGKCVCKNKLNGLNCNRNHALCPKMLPPCGTKEICLTFVHAKRCVSKNILLPILLEIPFNNFETDFHYEIEEYITEVLDGKESRHFEEIFSSRKRRSSSSGLGYYVEGSELIKVKSLTYVQYAVMDIEKDFTPVDATLLCSKFAGNSIHCLNSKECNLLKSVGQSCHFIYNPQFERHTATKSESLQLWVIVIICVAILIVISLLFLFLRKRGLRFKQITTSRRQETNQNTDSSLLAVAYSCPPPPYSVGDSSNMANAETFDIPVFSGVAHSHNKDRHLYESVENLRYKINDVYEPMGNESKIDSKKMMVELPPYEARYTEHLIKKPAVIQLKDDVNESKEEVHYAVPTNNKLARPESESDEE